MTQKGQNTSQSIVRFPVSSHRVIQAMQDECIFITLFFSPLKLKKQTNKQTNFFQIFNDELLE